MFCVVIRFARGAQILKHSNTKDKTIFLRFDALSLSGVIVSFATSVVLNSF